MQADPRPVRPASEAEIQAVVQEAERRGTQLRVVGAGHSFTPLCESSGILIDLESMQGLSSADPVARRATIAAGTRLYQLGPELRWHGLAMENMGDIDRQALAGAVSTGTHGTGRRLGSISTQVAALRFVDGAGDLVDTTEQDTDLLSAARLALGSLGILTEITLRLVPSFRLREQTWRQPFEACMERLEEYVERNRHFEFFWDPRRDLCLMKSLNPTDADPRSLGGPPPGVPGVRVRSDHSDRIFPSIRADKFNEIEFSVPERAGPECVRELRRLMQRRFSDVAWPLEYRTLAADELYLSPAYRRPSVTISAHQGAGLPYRRFFAEVEAIFRSYRGRPHWGKHHGLTAPALAPLYPEWNRFLELRERFDPAGVFLNDYLRRLLYG